MAHLHQPYDPYYQLQPPPPPDRGGINTLFGSGFPDDFKASEIYNLFRPRHGFNSCQIKYTGHDRNLQDQNSRRKCKPGGSDSDEAPATDIAAAFANQRDLVVQSHENICQICTKWKKRSKPFFASA